MGDRDNGLAPITDMKRLRYADLREDFISSYVAAGNKSPRTKSDGTENIAGLATLDEFWEYKTETIDGRIVIVNKGVPATSWTPTSLDAWSGNGKLEALAMRQSTGSRLFATDVDACTKVYAPKADDRALHRVP